MKLSACIDIMMPDKDVAAKIHAVKAAGLPAFEFWGWENKDLDILEAAAKETDLQVATFCTQNHSLVDPIARESFLAGLQATIPVAQRLGCDRLITQTGAERPSIARSEQLESLIAGLVACVPMLQQSGITLLVEPLNILVDHHGYFLYHAEEAFAVVREVDSPYVKVLYDIYHQQITEGNLIPTIRKNIHEIGHFHVADHPGRHQPGTGEINYANVFRTIEDTGYQGFVGLEFRPTVPDHQALVAVRELTCNL